MTAYEELKAWCEKHLNADDYKAVPESRTYAATIYLTDCGVGSISFNRDGSVCGIGTLDEDDMIEHINEVEREEEMASEVVADPLQYSPPPNSIGGQMVRRMIEMYERQAR